MLLAPAPTCNRDCLMQERGECSAFPADCGERFRLDEEMDIYSMLTNGIFTMASGNSSGLRSSWLSFLMHILLDRTLLHARPYLLARKTPHEISRAWYVRQELKAQIQPLDNWVCWVWSNKVYYHRGKAMAKSCDSASRPDNLMFSRISTDIVCSLLERLCNRACCIFPINVCLLYLIGKCVVHVLHEHIRDDLMAGARWRIKNPLIALQHLPWRIKMQAPAIRLL